MSAPAATAAPAAPAAPEAPAAAPVAPAATAPAAPAAPAPAAVPAAPVSPAAPAAPVQPAAQNDPMKAIEARLAAMEGDLQRERRARIGAEAGLKPEAYEFLTAGDETGLKAQADKLKAMFGTPAAAAAPATPPAAGTVTQPPAAGQPTLDQQIEAATKAGNHMLALELSLQQMRS